MNDDDEFSHLVKLNYTVNETAEIIGICRDQVYILLDEGELDGKKVGAKLTGTRVTRKSIIEYQKRLPKYERKNKGRREFYGKKLREKKSDAA